MSDETPGPFTCRGWLRCRCECSCPCYHRRLNHEHIGRPFALDAVEEDFDPLLLSPDL